MSLNEAAVVKKSLCGEMTPTYFSVQCVFCQLHGKEDGAVLDCLLVFVISESEA